MLNHRLLVVLIVRAIKDYPDLGNGNGRGGGNVILEVHGTCGVSTKAMTARARRAVIRRATAR